MHCTVCAHPFRSLSLSLSPSLSFSLIQHDNCLRNTPIQTACVYISFRVAQKKSRQLCSGTRFNRLRFVRMSTKSRDTGLVMHLPDVKWTGLNSLRVSLLISILQKIFYYCPSQHLTKRLSSTTKQQFRRDAPWEERIPKCCNILLQMTAGNATT